MKQNKQNYRLIYETKPSFSLNSLNLEEEKKEQDCINKYLANYFYLFRNSKYA